MTSAMDTDDLEAIRTEKERLDAILVREETITGIFGPGKLDYCGEVTSGICSECGKSDWVSRKVQSGSAPSVAAGGAVYSVPDSLPSKTVNPIGLAGFEPTTS